MRDIVLYKGKRAGEKSFMMEIGNCWLVLLEKPGEGIPTVVSDEERGFLFSLPIDTLLELMVRVK